MAKVNTWLIQDNLVVLAAWKRAGYSDEQIAKKISISRSTLNAWKKKHPDIKKALDGSDEIANRRVEARLYDMTQGYMVQKRKPIKVKEIKYNEKGQKTEEIEKIEIGIEDEYIKPDFRAQQFWLVNKNPKEWSNAYAQIEQKEEEQQVVILEERVKNGIKNNMATTMEAKGDAK